MPLSDKAIQEYKDIFKKKYGKDLSDAEAKEQGENLLGFFELLFKMAEKEYLRKQRLKREKIKGFFLDADEGAYSCGICGENYPGNNIWWNPKGLKCRDCWRNIKNRVIPDLKYKHDHNEVWIQEWQIKYDYGVHPSTARKLSREGLLHGRDLKRENGMTYCTIYLVKENKGFLKKYPKKPAIKVKFVNPEINKTMQQKT